MPTTVDVRTVLGTPGAAREGAMRPAYGAEVPAMDWYDNLRRILSSVAAQRRASPVYMPFPSGTPTLAARQFLETARHQAASEALQAARAGGGGQAASPKLGSTEYKTGVRMAILQSARKQLEDFVNSYGGSPPAGELENVIGRISQAAGVAAAEHGLDYEDVTQIPLDVADYLRQIAPAPAPPTRQGTGWLDRIRQWLSTPRESQEWQTRIQDVLRAQGR